MRDERRRCLRERREGRRAFFFRGCFVDGARGGTLVVAKRRMRRATLDGPAAGAVERGPVRRGRLPEGRARGRAAIRRRPLPLADAERRRPVVEALRGRVVRRFPARGQPFGRGAVRGRTVSEVEGRRARARAGREGVRRRPRDGRLAGEAPRAPRVDGVELDDLGRRRRGRLPKRLRRAADGGRDGRHAAPHGRARTPRGAREARARVDLQAQKRGRRRERELDGPLAERDAEEGAPRRRRRLGDDGEEQRRVREGPRARDDELRADAVT